MSSNQHICSIEYIEQTVCFVYQHISGTGTHEKFDATYTMFVQLVEFRIVIISGSEVAGVVNNTLLIQQIKFLFERTKGGSQRVGVRHIHDGSDTTCGCCTTFGENIRFVG